MSPFCPLIDQITEPASPLTPTGSIGLHFILSVFIQNANDSRFLSWNLAMLNLDNGHYNNI